MLRHPILDLRELKVLKQKSVLVTKFDNELRRLVREMFETMYAAPGIGLAAVQIGIHQRIIILDVSDKETERVPHVFINAEVIWASKEISPYEEGCLSIPDYYEMVERPSAVKVKYQDEYGKHHVISEGGSLLATCLQHEIDHTEGKLFIDRISKLKRDRVLKKYWKLARQENADDTRKLPDRRKMGAALSA